MPLPANPTYLSLVRPGHTPNANFYASPQILSGPTAPTVTVQYRLFDPDGSRNPGITEHRLGTRPCGWTTSILWMGAAPGTPPRRLAR